MQELIQRMEEQGLTTEEAMLSLQTVIEWVDVTYPVAGALVKAWIRDNQTEEVAMSIKLP